MVSNVLRTPFTCEPDSAVTKTAQSNQSGNDRRVRGDTVTYRITVENTRNPEFSDIALIIEFSDTRDMLVWVRRLPVWHPTGSTRHQCSTRQRTRSPTSKALKR